MAEQKKMIRALSLWRPWAWAMRDFVNCDDEYDIGPKRVENRTYPIPSWLIGHYVALHAAKKWDAGAYDWLVEESGCPVPPKEDASAHPAGVIYAVATLVRTIEHEQDCPDDQLFWYMGGYGWLLGDFVAIEPVLCVGQQGFFPLPTECSKHGNVYEAVRRNFATALKTPYLPPASSPLPLPETDSASEEQPETQPEQKGLF